MSSTKPASLPSASPWMRRRSLRPPRWQSPWRPPRALLLAGAFSLSTVCAACNESGHVPLERNLPPRPTWWGRVEVQHQAGDDLEVVAARERAGRAEANDRLDQAGRWYDCVRTGLAGPPSNDCESPEAGHDR